MRDFTLAGYEKLLRSLLDAGYEFLTLEEFIRNPGDEERRVVLMRHDVDRTPGNSVKTAKIEETLGVKASYYFRIGSESNRPKMIKKIAGSGHEIGYHYEDLARSGGDYEKAIVTFEKNLEYFRTFYPVSTMCMHGSPLSKWDNRRLWEKYDYKKYGIIAEPYFDLNFNQVFYLTDASRSWNNKKVSVRDSVRTEINVQVNSMDDIFSLAGTNKLPGKIMINIHPHNWAEAFPEWLFILSKQAFKNQFKRILILLKK